MQVFNRSISSLVSVVSVTLLFSCLLIIPADALAGEKPEEISLPESIYPEIDYLLNFSEKDDKPGFKSDMINGLINFIESDKKDSSIYVGKTLNNATSAYYEFDINKEFQSFLEYSYNPDIPDSVFVPSSLKLSKWSDRDSNPQPFPNLAAMLTGLNDPVVANGISYTEITPDSNTGAYYSYASNQTYILMKKEGRRILVSVTRQKDKSDVGRKGYPVHEDDDWHYFYSGKKGLTKCGLGWVSSYIYDSFSVSIYIESEEGGKIIKNGIFKWVNAGWKDINMVKNTHIYEGLDKYAVDFKSMIESPELPRPDSLSKTFVALNTLSVNELRDKVNRCFASLSKKWEQEGVELKKKIARQYLSSDYISSMSREEMISILSKEYMRSVLGKKISIALDSPIWIVDEHREDLGIN